MIRQVVLATVMAAGLAAQARPASHLVDLLVFGNHTLIDGKLGGQGAELQAAVDAHIQRAVNYKSKLVPPKKMASLDGMVYEARVGYERLLAATSTDPRAAALAAEYVLTLRPCYEWEGYHDCPEAEAVFADRYQSTHPDGPFREFLPLFAAHRWLCTAEAYVYETKPDEARRAREAYARDIAIAKQSTSLLMRAGAEGLAARETCNGPDPAAAVIATVTDSAGNVVPGVTISATHRPWTPVKCITNIRGECSLAGIPPTHYRLEAVLSGFVTQTIDVELADGRAYPWNVKMIVIPLRTRAIVLR